MRKKLINLRKEKGYTREDIAKEAGVETDTYKAYELGKRTPRLETMRLIMDKLGTDSILIFEDERC